MSLGALTKLAKYVNQLINDAGIRSDLIDPLTAGKASGMIPWKRSAPTGVADKVSKMLDAQTVNLWEFANYVTNIGSYFTNPWVCDWAPALAAAFATGKRVYAPGTTSPYVIMSKVSLPYTACHLVGDGDTTLFALNVVMDHVFERIDNNTSAALAPVSLEYFKIDCIRRADWGLWIESSKGGTVRNVNVVRPLVGGAMLGSDTGTSGYYENEISEPSFDGGSFYSDVVDTMPSYGLYLGISATDNTIFHCVSAYIKETGIYIRGASNKFYSPHAYGNNATDTGPKYCIVAEQTCEITNSHNDNPTIAGISIRASNVQVIGGTYQWAADNTPTLGGAVPIEISTGLNEIVILGGNPRGENVSNPTIRYLGTRPIRSSILGISPYQPAVGEDAGHFVTRQLGIASMAGYRTQFNIDAAVDNSAAMRFSRNGILRYEWGTTATTESGGNAGTDFLVTARKDDGSTAEFFRYYRQYNLTELIGQVKVGTTNVGFYGANPVAKPTVTGAKGGNAALTSLIAALVSMGQITDTTT